MTYRPHLTPPTDVWSLRLDALGLRVEDSPVWPLVQKLYAELRDRGLAFQPPVFVANEWGCPDEEPIIGIPFFLVDPLFHPIEEEHADDLEDEARILQGLRHEAGHAVNYAYRLWEEPEWARTFGDFYAEYRDDYCPEPFSPQFVRHLPGWYAQKHPDEDFAETFAVWLTPGLDWRARYSGTPALAKLEYVDRTMARLAGQPPIVDPASCAPDPDELAFTVAEYYRMRAEADAGPTAAVGTLIDHDLRELFSAGGIGTDAATLVWDRRKSLMRSVSDYTGSRMYVVKTLIDHVVARLRALGLRARPGGEVDALIGLTALLCTMTANFLRTGQYVTLGAGATIVAD